MSNSDLAINTKRRKKNRRPWAFPLGVLIFALAVYGALSLLGTGVETVKAWADKSALKAEYEQFLTPVVRNDPRYYEDLSKAKNEELLDSAIWHFLSNGGLTKKEYDFSEVEPIGFIVPSDDIKESYVYLFGSEFDPKYETVNGPGYTFTYDMSNDSFIISVTSAAPLYLPRVLKIQKHGSSTILTVGYINSKKENFNTDKHGNFIEPLPDKHVKITLRKTQTDPGYYVSAIEGLEAVETATIPDFTPSPTETEIPTIPEVTTTESTTESGNETEDSTADESLSTSKEAN